MPARQIIVEPVVNLLLFPPAANDNGIVVVSGRQCAHLKDQLKVALGDSVRVGEIGGSMGNGEVVAMAGDTISLKVELTAIPPPPLPLRLILSLPRPKMLRRILQTVASLGIVELHLINSFRVEKSYWQTPWLEATALEEQLLLGLEQCCDTTLPRVYQHKRFKPFVEDLLPGIVAGTRPLLAHPYCQTSCPVAVNEPLTLAIGPEGGFIPYEVEKLIQCGFEPVTLGTRILRVETAIPVLVSRLFC
ncbi:MAG: 16S rRNA methyltransferase [Gammaproteobacteria bacterium BRH_c0]|nr:MAG: 16S rRNA methyltransferase [Gammaproteobacteria bacterium BRH_c0]